MEEPTNSWIPELPKSNTNLNSNRESLPALPEMPNETPKPGDADYNAFEDPDSVWYGIQDFRPRGSRPIPTMRCHRIKPNGEQCKNRGIRGSGLNGTLPCCPAHGGSLPGLKEYSKAVTEAARLQIFSGAPDAVQTIMEVMGASSTPSNVKLKAAEMLLDRAGIRGGMEIEVEVKDVREKPSDILRKKLESMRDKDADKAEEEDIIDAEPLEDLGEAKAAEESS